MFAQTANAFARCPHLRCSVPVDQTLGECAERHGCKVAACPLERHFAASARPVDRGVPLAFVLPFGIG